MCYKKYINIKKKVEGEEQCNVMWRKAFFETEKGRVISPISPLYSFSIKTLLFLLGVVNKIKWEELKQLVKNKKTKTKTNVI